MKKFNFDLQPVLDYRNHEKEDAEMELNRALSVEYEIKQNLEEIANQYLVLKKNMKATFDFYDTVQNNQNKKLLDYQKEELLRQLAQAQIITAEKRQILAEIMKKTTALEKLKEKELESYKAAVNFEENEFVDEISTLRFNT